MKRPRATGIMAWAGASRCWGLLRAVLAIPLLAGPVGAQQTSVQAGGELAVKTVRQIEALLAAKAQRTPAQRKVSSQLLPARRAQVYGVASRQAPDTTATDEMAMVDIQADVTPEVLARIRALGGTIINSVGRYRAIRANLPTAAGEQLAALEAVQSIRPADVAVTPGRAQGLRSNIRSDVATTRAVDTSEGDVAHQANVARQTYSVDGTGIGIGVISDGVDTLAGQQETGDVPARVTVLPGQAGGSISYACGGSSKGTEGTAMLEIVHDLAPGGELLFATGIGGAAQMAQNIEDLCAAGADIIVDDIGYLRASAFQDDVIAQAVSAAAGNGCYYFSSAGNGGNLNDGTAGVWEGDYAAGSPVTVNGVPVGVTHDFGGGEEENRIKRNSTNPISLQWSDPAGGSENDYDLFLIDADDNVLASSTNTQDGTQDPIEWIRGSCSDDREDTRLVIVKNTGAADRYLRLNYAREGLEIATAGHTFGHSASKDAVGVAAVDVTTAGGAGSVFNGTESVETFSSDGPRRIFFEADGTPITPGNFSSTGGRVLQKPDLAAADAVSTSTPGFSPFRGTSAAAPHAAAIAALMLEAAGGPDNVTLTALRAAMTGASLDIEATGVDRDSGAGLVMAPGAVDAVDVAVVDRNGVPTVSGTLDNRTMLRGADAVTVNVASEFSDPDNDTLTYNALSSDPDRVAVTRTGSQLTLTPGLPGLAVVTVRATDGGGLSAGLSFLVTVALGNRDYDVDDDGLIEVGNLAQLDAVRYDLNGDGVVDDALDWQSYYDAFDQSSLMGCPDGCTGYELTASLDFDTNNSGAVAPGDTYWNNGESWAPIGGEDTSAIGRLLFLSNPFVAIFEGNGHTVSNLFIDTNNVVLVGLFGYASSSIRNMGVIDVDVKGADLAGGLIGFNAGEIRASYVTGRVTGVTNVGGLVGINQSNGEILASYSTSRVSGEDDVGGLVGENRGAITAVYSTGRVAGIDNVGGLVGFNQSTGEILASYVTGRVTGDSDAGGLVGSNEGAITASYWDKHTSGHTAGSFGEGKTTAELQAPTASSGIYPSWNLDLDGDHVNDWHFGTARQYPVLSVDTNGVGGATWQEFGYQLREGPTLTAAAQPTEVALSWTAVNANHWSSMPDITYTLYRENSATVKTLAEGAGGLQYTDTDVTIASTYTYQVAAVATGGEAARSAQVSVTVPVPISEIGLTASGGDKAVRLNWNRPSDDGGSPIIRYEYRYAAVGEEWSDWQNVAATAVGVTVGNLVNGREYAFGVRAVNPLGKGPVETARATPVGPPPGPGNGGFGGGGAPGGGPRQTVPDAPTNLLADGGNEQVRLSWEAPENDGGFAITDYEVRINGRGSWISTGSIHTTHTVTGLTNGTAYVFQVRAVNAAGRSPYSNRAEAAPGVGALDFAHFANGAGIISDLVFVNVATHPIRPVLYFYDQEGQPIDPESVVDLTGDLEVTEDGALSIQMEMEPLGELTISTHGQGEVVSGSVQVVSDGPIGGFLRFDLPGIGVAGVGASQPVRDVIFPARRRGGLSTAVAIRNLGEEALGVSCRLMSGGIVLEEAEIPLEANGQEARYIEELFPLADTSDFVGSVRCTAPGLFTGVAVELDAGNRIFTTLPVVPVARTGGAGQEAGLSFAHFANGETIVSDLVFVNRSTQPSGPGPTPFHATISPSRPVLYFYDKEGQPIDPESVVDLTGDLEVTEDGALSIQTEMEPLGELTISTHGRGEGVSGSVQVVSDGPIGGFLRFDLTGIGVAGVGASQPVRDAIFPARRLARGISTAAAIQNLGEEAMGVSCRLMQGGIVLEEVEIYLGANGQEALYIEELFTGTDTSDFVGSVRCTAPGEGMFTGVAVELDAGSRIFTTLPVVPVQR